MVHRTVLVASPAAATSVAGSRVRGPPGLGSLRTCRRRRQRATCLKRRTVVETKIEDTPSIKTLTEQTKIEDFTTKVEELTVVNARFNTDFVSIKIENVMLKKEIEERQFQLKQLINEVSFNLLNLVDQRMTKAEKILHTIEQNDKEQTKFIAGADAKFEDFTEASVDTQCRIFDKRFQAIERDVQFIIAALANRKENSSMEDIRGNCRWLALQVTNLKNETNMKFDTKADKDDIINLRNEINTTFTTRVDNLKNEMNTTFDTKIDNILSPNWCNAADEMYLDVRGLAAIRAASRRHAALISDF